jgi:hypothetical protein
MHNVFLIADFNLNHYASARSDVMLLLTGGRDASGKVESSTFAKLNLRTIFFFCAKMQICLSLGHILDKKLLN